MLGLAGKGTILYPIVSALRNATLKGKVWKEVQGPL